MGKKGPVDSRRAKKAVAIWLFMGVGMLVVQVVLGGLTRLTGSGLSITEWDPIMGFLPPMNAAEWQKAFEGYQQIAQYKFINNHYTLSDFKFIFFWEWFHRLWARLMGVVFLIPFIYFLIKGYFKKSMIFPLIMLFVLGGLQGLVGWIMVQSGLNEENVYVSHIRLAVHFMAAMVLIVYTLIFALSLVSKKKDFLERKGMLNFSILIIILLSIQLIYGCFMAGLKAAAFAPTWPDINGKIVPDNLFAKSFITNAFYNPLAIHFVHRTLAYVLFIVTVLWWIKARKLDESPIFNRLKNWPLILVFLQVILGIITVLNGDEMGVSTFGLFESFAQLHQLTGMLLFLVFIAAAHYLKETPRKLLQQS